MKLPPSPAALIEAGAKFLPCGFPLQRETYRARFAHQRECPHAYCRWRMRARRLVAQLLFKKVSA